MPRAPANSRCWPRELEQSRDRASPARVWTQLSQHCRPSQSRPDSQPDAPTDPAASTATGAQRIRNPNSATTHMHAAHAHRSGIAGGRRPHAGRRARRAGRQSWPQQPAEILEMLERDRRPGVRRHLRRCREHWPSWKCCGRWPASELDPELVEQSREQYLRCALSICSDCAEGRSSHGRNGRWPRSKCCACCSKNSTHAAQAKFWSIRSQNWSNR